MSADQQRRRYDSVRRTTQAQQTRADIAQAAREVFEANGWAATTVRDVALKAGVAIPTVYAAYGNKAGLIWAVADAADLTADVPRMLAALEDSAGDPGAQLGAMAAYDRRLFEQAGDVITLVRDAGRADPELATAYGDARRRGDATRVEVFSSWPVDALREELTVATAVDVYGAICNIDVFRELTVERSWSPDSVEQWWRRALVRELLR